jgi:amino acid transporter
MPAGILGAVNPRRKNNPNLPADSVTSWHPKKKHPAYAECFFSYGSTLFILLLASAESTTTLCTLIFIFNACLALAGLFYLVTSEPVVKI